MASRQSNVCLEVSRLGRRVLNMSDVVDLDLLDLDLLNMDLMNIDLLNFLDMLQLDRYSTITASPACVPPCPHGLDLTCRSSLIGEIRPRLMLTHRLVELGNIVTIPPMVRESKAVMSRCLETLGPLLEAMTLTSPVVDVGSSLG